VYFAPLKAASVGADGTLRLKWWHGNERRKGPRLPVAAAGTGGASGARFLAGTLPLGTSRKRRPPEVLLDRRPRHDRIEHLHHLGAAAYIRGEPPVSARPNILFISTDQHRGDALSACVSPRVRTPSLDALHGRGVSFMRSCSPAPVCAPVHDSIPDLGQILTANGYAALHAGKWHVDGRPMEKSFRNIHCGGRRIQASAGEVYDPAITHSAISFLGSYRGHEPFFLAVEYVNPHDICEYIHYHETKSLPGPVGLGIEQLFDLRADPGENTNLACDEAYRPRRDSLRTLLAGVERPLIRAQITDASARNRIAGLAGYLRSK
jgi:hypothetical protein